MSLLDDWDIEREQIYKFFADENIDILGCAKFDFVKREFKSDGTTQQTCVGDGLSDYEQLRSEKICRNKAYLAKLGLDNPNNIPASSALQVNPETTENNSDEDEETTYDDETMENSDEVETTENATDDNEKKGDDRKSTNKTMQGNFQSKMIIFVTQRMMQKV